MAVVRAIRLSLALLVVVTPAVTAHLLAATFFGAGLCDARPIWSDEFIYWHEVATYRAVGPNGGYYAYDEEVSPLPFLHQGPHGPFFPALYGVPARWFGWGANGLVHANLALFTLALGLFVLVVRPGLAQLLALELLLLTFWPLHLYAASSMQQLLHLSFAVIFALLARRSTRGERTAPRGWGLTVALISIAALVRPTWSLLLMPFAWLVFVRRGGWIRWGALGGAAVLVAVFFAVARVTWTVFGKVGEGFRVSSGDAFAGWLEGAANQLGALLSPTQDAQVSVFLRYQILAVLVGTLGLVLLPRVREKLRAAGGKEDSGSRTEAVFHLLNLALPLAVVLVFYDLLFWRGFRVLAPHLFLSAMFAVAMGGQRRLAAVALLSCYGALALPGFAASYRDLHAERFSVWRADAAFSRAVGKFVVYDEARRDRWENTLLIDRYHPDLMQVPPGIGLTLLRDAGRVDPERRYGGLSARYLLLGGPARQHAASSPGLERVATTRYGDLFVAERGAGR